MRISNIFFLLFYLLMMILILQGLKNLSSIYIFAIVGLFTFLLFKVNFNFTISKKISISSGLYYIFLFLTIFSIIWTFFYWNTFAFINAAPRALAMPLFIIIMFNYLKKENDFHKALAVIIVCYLIGSLSLLYQINYGTMEWLAKSVNRGGVKRFSTILGSLTIFPSILGYAVLILLSGVIFQNNKVFRSLLLLLFIISSFLSLSKGGLMVLIISILIFIIFYFRISIKELNVKNTIISISILVILVFLISQNFEFISRYYNISMTQLLGPNNLFSNSDSIQMSAPPINFEQIYMRLFHWVNLNLIKYGNIVFIFGIGLPGGGGIFALENYGMSHNSFGDLFFIGGPIYLICFLLMYFTVQIYLLKNYDNNMSKLLFFLNIIFFANMCYASGSIYHPAISMPFWLSLVYCRHIHIRALSIK